MNIELKSRAGSILPVFVLMLMMTGAMAVDVTLKSDNQPAFPTGTTVTFTATATGVNRATIYTFAVIDGNFKNIGGAQGTASTRFYVHVRNVQDEFTVTR